MRLTIRVDGDHLVASTDHGRTIHITLADHPDLGAGLQEVEGAILAAADPSAGASATALASLAEAASLRPETGDPPPCHPIASATVDGPRIALGRHVDGAPSAPLRDVLARRRSRRNLGPAFLPDMAALLVRAGRTRTVADLPGGGQVDSRPFPSAGARHPHELVLACEGVEGLDDGWWWFDPFTCELSPVAVEPNPDAALAALADVAAMDPPPTAAVFAVAAFSRTLSRYRAGSTLVWRDAGAALATLHLAATDLGLASCIIGTADTIQLAVPDDGNLLGDVGAVALGSIKDSA